MKLLIYKSLYFGCDATMPLLIFLAWVTCGYTTWYCGINFSQRNIISSFYSVHGVGHASSHANQNGLGIGSWPNEGVSLLWHE